jgi:hypothetical protein
MTTSYYTDGTISVSNGGTTYTGVGTAFITAGLREGDKFLKNGYVVRLTADPASETSFTAEAWPGTTLSGATYAIEYLADGSRLSAAVYDLILTLASSGNLDALGALVGAADKLAYFTGAGAMALTDLPALARQFLANAGADSRQLTNLGIKASVGSSQLTIELKQKDGATDCTATLPAIIGFRDATLANGDYLQRTVSAALSIVIPSGATMGQSNATAANLYLYAIDNAGTIELAVAGTDFGDGGRISTTILNTSSDAADTMYSTTARSNVAFRKIGKLVNTQATAGTWATAPSAIQPAPFGELETEAFKALKDDTSLAAILTTLGGQPLDSDLTAIAALSTTTFGRALLTAADRGSLLTLGNVMYDLGTIADDTSVSVNLGTVAEGATCILQFNTNTSVIFSARTAATSTGCLLVAKTTTAWTVTLAAASAFYAGTTGTDGQVSVGAHSSGVLSIENRTGAIVPAQLFVFKKS